MSQRTSDGRQNVEKVLRLECSRGYLDNAATCGLEEFIAKNVPGATSVVSGYSQLAHFDRQRVVEEIMTYLQGGITRGREISAADLSKPVSKAIGVGKRTAKKLGKLGIVTIEDLLLYLPRKLEDRSRFVSTNQLKVDEQVCVSGKILAIDQIHASKRTNIVKAAIGDDWGIVYAVWFNQPWVAKQLKRGEKIDIYGKVEKAYGTIQLHSPVWEPSGEHNDLGRLVPIYSVTAGITDRLIRKLIASNLRGCSSALQDIIPECVLQRQNLLSKREAVYKIHFPQNAEEFELARRSLAFEELFLLNVGLAVLSRSDIGKSHTGSQELANSFMSRLGFELTEAQDIVLKEIVDDLRSEQKMMRLLQGDVGSGKTIVAVVSALFAVDAGCQVAIMVPTEILAEQHFLVLKQLLKSTAVTIELLTSSSSNKDEIKTRLSDGEIDLLVGTHAVIQEDVSFSDLGLVIIDEQHRFGVMQRSVIEDKGQCADLLVMTATPIPRTIALTFYGEFEVSKLDEMPFGEKDIRTFWVEEARREEVYAKIRQLLSEGGRGYVVLPLVEESEELDLRAAVEVEQELQEAFAEFGVAIIHGRMSGKEKDDTMTAFRSGDVHLLVSTTVIEVGIDVLDANFMVIEHAERFGLSQLHQLRGRIGRRGQPAICFALGTASTEAAEQRLTAFTKYLDGKDIAEEDLRIRGPGDLLGTKQHGFLSSLKAVDLMQDVNIMLSAREAAYATYNEGVPAEMSEVIETRFGNIINLLCV